MKPYEVYEHTGTDIAEKLMRCDIANFTAGMLADIVGEADVEKAAQKILTVYPNIKLLTVAMGKDGSMAWLGKEVARADAYLREPVDYTKESHEAFCKYVLEYVSENGLSGYGSRELEKMLVFANVAEALVASQKGPDKVMPDKMQIINTYLAGKVQGKCPGQDKKPMHVCQHTGEEPCQFHTQHHHDILEAL